MNIYSIVLSFLLLSGCSTFKADKQIENLSKSGHYFVIGCSISDLNLNHVKAYPGLFCIFQEDGSLISYDSKKTELVKYDKYLKKIWHLNMHVHHYISRMSNGDILVNSSTVKDVKGVKDFKFVRLDQIVRVSQEGKILSTFTFNPEFSYDKGKLYPMPMSWEPHLKYDFEFTHVSSSKEMNYDFILGNTLIAPKGSVMVSMNAEINGVVILDSKLSEIQFYIPFSNSFHDADMINQSEILYFKNNVKLQPKTEDEKSGATILNFKTRDEVFKFSEKSYGLFGGSVQKIADDLFVMCDTGSKHSAPFKIITDKFPKSNIRLAEHEGRKSRITFFSRKSGFVKDFHLDYAFNSAKVHKLDEFLKNNIGP